MAEKESIPTFMYKDGENGVIAKLFDHPDDVPKGEGWRESPKKSRGRPAGSKNKPKEEE